MSLKQSDYVSYGSVIVGLKPGSEKDWKLYHHGSDMSFYTLDLAALLDLRGALNELHDAIFGGSSSTPPLKRLAPPIDTTVDA